MLRMWAGTAVIVCTLCASPSLGAYQLTVGDTVLEFDPGTGMCHLDDSKNEFDRLVLDWQRETQAANNNYLLGVYVDCSRLDRLRGGEEVDLGQYGILLAVGGGPNGPKKLTTHSRADFLSEMSSTMRKGVALDAAKIAERSFNALDDTLKEAVGELQVGQVRQLGELDRDESAIYIGYLMNTRTNFGEEITAGTSGLTLVKTYPVQYSLYRSFVDKSSFDILMNDLRGVMRDLVTKNEPLESRIHGLPQVVPEANSGLSFLQRIDWERVAISAVVGAVVAGMVGLGRRLKSSKGKAGDPDK